MPPWPPAFSSMRSGANAGDVMSFCIDRLHSGGLIVNYRCPASCAHCLYACGPGRASDYMTPAMASHLAGRLVEMGCDSVHIGGGEPLLERDGLCGVLDALRAGGVDVCYVETNCFWAASERQARQAVRLLREHGLTRLLVSIDPFHNSSIPFQRVLTAMAACQAEGMGVFPWQMEFAEDIQRLDPARPHSLEEYATVFGRDYAMQVFRRYGLTFGGRAAIRFRDRLGKMPASRIVTQPSPCRRLAETSHFHIDHAGRYIPGLCTGFAIPVAALGRPLTDYPLLSLLYRDGIGALRTLTISDFGYKDRDDGYCQACDLCLDIRRHIVRTSPKAFPELGPEGFYALLDKETGGHPG
jgi:uncharacterized Fe-S cluster-containing radical SAM superfamily protein